MNRSDGAISEGLLVSVKNVHESVFHDVTTFVSTVVGPVAVPTEEPSPLVEAERDVVASSGTKDIDPPVVRYEIDLSQRTFLNTIFLV